MDLNVRRLPLETAQWLVDHHARVWQAETLTFCTCGQQERAH